MTFTSYDREAPAYERVVEELADSLARRLPFDTAWEALSVHPTPEWIEDAEGASGTPWEFLKRACRAHYEYRLAELLGDPLDFEPPIYALFVHEPHLSPTKNRRNQLMPHKWDEVVKK